MKTKKIRWMGILLVLVMVLTCTAGYTPAKAGEYAIITDNKYAVIGLASGTTVHEHIPIKFLAQFDNVSAVKADSTAAKGFTIDNLKLVNGSDVEAISGTTNIRANDVWYLDFDVTVKDTAKIGTYPVDIKAKHMVFDESGAQYEEDVILTLDFFIATESSPAQIAVKKVDYDTEKVMPGGSFDLKLTVSNEGQTEALNTYVKLILPECMYAGYAVELHKVGNLSLGKSETISFPINLVNGCEPGQYPITAVFTYKDSTGDESTSEKTFYVIVKEVGKVDNSPFITMSSPDNYKELESGSKDSITVVLKNEGDADAKNVKIKVTGGFGIESGITKDYTNEYINVGTIGAGKSQKAMIPFIVAKKLSSMTEISIQVEYTDAKGAMNKANSMSLYLCGPEGVSDDKMHDLINISEVLQSPSVPVAGGNMSVSLKVSNDGTHEIRDFRIGGTNLSSAGFEPVSSDPYIYVGSIAQGSSKRITLPFKVGKEIPEGLNQLSLSYTYLDANDETQTGAVSLYILNVENNLGASVGKPKLIINKWETVSENGILAAGGEFDLTFELLNTHATKAAKNIKVTVSQAEGVFSAAAGSNMFYISKIGAGESVVNTLRLKTKSSAATGDYDLTILVEYEYDDMNDVDKEHGGVAETNTLKLHATENYRPQIENVFVESYDGVYVGQEVSLSFEFYNMGQSRLGNVYLTVEGDFELANNSEMSYIGAIDGYGQEYVNPSIVPLVAGDANGKIIIHFEDSNGDEKTIEQSFNAWVDEMGGGFDDPGMFPGGDFPGFDMPIEEPAEPILPVWLFVVILVVLMGAGTLITYKVIIASKRKKLQKEADEAE